MICSGASFKIFAANADCPGSQHDARVYRESELYRRLAVDKFKPIPHGVILADKAYPVSFLIHFMLELNLPSRFLPVALSEEGLVAKYPVVEPSND